MSDPDKWVVVGLDNGGTTNNATVLDAEDRFLVDRMVETPSYVREGPEKAIEALALSFEQVLELTGTPREIVRAVGLDTPGPVSGDGVISSRGATNFGNPEWRGFDVGVIERGQVVQGAAGMAGELGHVWIPMDGLLGPGQPVPVCNCGLSGDAESVASLTGIEKNLLPYWLSRFPEHELAGISPKGTAAKLVRGDGEAGDELALEIFTQQAMAVGRLFSIAANFTDPDVYFVGGGVVEAAPQFRDGFLDRVREHTILREEQERAARIALVPDLDMAGARGSAIAASAAVR